MLFGKDRVRYFTPRHYYRGHETGSLQNPQFGYCPYLQGIELDRAMWQRCAAHLQEAEEQNLPEPQIVEIGMRLRFIVPLSEPLPLRSPPKASRHKLGVESGVESDMAMRIIALLEKEFEDMLSSTVSGVAHGIYLK